MFGVYVQDDSDLAGQPPATSGLLGANPGMLGEGMVPGSILVATVPSLPPVAAGLGVDPMTLWGDVATAFDVGHNGPGIELVAHIDPDGQGGRWIEPLVTEYRGPTLLLNDLDAGDIDIEAWADRELGEMEVEGVHVRTIAQGSDDERSVAAFWATGPFVFQVHAALLPSPEETIADLVWGHTCCR